jgi:hypothetical protein
MEDPKTRTMPRLLSVPRDVASLGKTVHTGIWKTPVQGRRMVRLLNIDADGQGDLAGHGGEHRAVFAYQIDSSRYWQAQLCRNDFTYAQFQENFIDGLPDGEVCIGDRYRIGRAVFEVTQPRATCYWVGIRMGRFADGGTACVAWQTRLLFSRHRRGRDRGGRGDRAGYCGSRAYDHRGG